MKCTAEILDVIRNGIEGMHYGEIKVKINESGDYVEISEEHRTRIHKEEDDSSYEGRTRVFRTDC
jgi:hypothetical protein